MVCNVCSVKAFETIHENVTDIVFFIVCKISFLLVLSKRSIRSKERVRTYKDYAIGREITTKLKIAVDSVYLELCDSRDYFARSLLVEKPINLIYRDIEDRKLLFSALLSNCSHRSFPEIS